MCKMNFRIYGLIVGFVLMWPMLSKADSYCCPDKEPWKASPSPTGRIVSTDGEIWDHIWDTDDYVALELRDHKDNDSECINDEWEVQTTNYLDNQATRWSCDENDGYVDPATGTSTKWYAKSTSSDTWVKAKLVDKSSTPHPDADDDDHFLTYTDVQGFKVGVRANFSGIYNDSHTVWEDEGDWSFSDPNNHTIYSANNGESNWGTDQNNDYFYVSFEAKTTPSHAVPQGDIQADLSFGLQAAFSGLVEDCDLTDQAGDSVSLAFNFSAFGVGAGFAYTWTLEDEQEAMSCADWSYTTSDGLGSQIIPTSTPAEEYESGDYPESSLPYLWSSTQNLSKTANKIWEKGDQIKAQYDFSIATYATYHCIDDVATSQCTFSNPVVKIENIDFSSN